MADEPLAGQWAPVTGGSKGIGLGVAGTLARAGASVAIVARGLPALEQARADVTALVRPGSEAIVRAVDIADPPARRSLFEWVRESLPALNIVVVNAGAGALVPFLEVTLDEW